MKACFWWLSLTVVVTESFVVVTTTTTRTTAQPFGMTTTHLDSATFRSAPVDPTPVNKVQVCGFKDCRSRGGGAWLEKVIQQIVEEKGLSTTVEACDCQGECGYGPNLLVDGKLFNNVRGRDAVLQALNIQDDDDD